MWQKSQPLLFHQGASIAAWSPHLLDSSPPQPLCTGSAPARHFTSCPPHTSSPFLNLPCPSRPIEVIHTVPSAWNSLSPGLATFSAGSALTTPFPLAHTTLSLHLPKHFPLSPAIVFIYLLTCCLSVSSDPYYLVQLCEHTPTVQIWRTDIKQSKLSNSQLALKQWFSIISSMTEKFISPGNPLHTCRNNAKSSWNNFYCYYV